MKKRITNSGFTLIELLVSITVLAVIGVVITSVLVQSLKGEKKVQILNQTKQNAQVVLDRIIKDVQSSSYVYCVGDNDPGSSGNNNFNQNNTLTGGSIDTLVLVSIDPATGNNIYDRYRFNNEVTGSANGYITFDTSSAVLSCVPTNPVQSNAQTLTNTDPTNGISLTYDNLVAPSGICNFGSQVFCDSQSAGSPDSITIRFRANAGVSAQSLFDTSEQQSGNSGVAFGSTTTIRNGSI